MAEKKREHESPVISPPAEGWSLGVPAQLPEDDEALILSSVRRSVWKHYQSGAELSSSRVSSQRAVEETTDGSWWGRPAWAMAGSLATLAVFLWSLGPSFFPMLQENQRLQVDGKFELRGPQGPNSLRSRDLSMQIPKGEVAGADLREAKRWHVRAFGGTSLRLIRRSRQHHVLKLRQGRIYVHVTPRQIRDFEIALPTYHIHVKGTRFSVERGPLGWWVEMEKGRIALQSSPSQKKSAQNKPFKNRGLVAGQGAIYNKKSSSLVVYPVPPKEAKDALKRVQWWLKRDLSDIALAWTEQLCEDGTQKRALCADSLQEIAEYFRGKQAWSRVLSLLLRVHRLNVVGRSELALPEALSLCRRMKHSSACMNVYRLTFRHNITGPFAEHANYWLAVGLAKQSQPPAKEINRLLWRYVRKYPGGQHLPNVLSMLLRWEKDRVLICRGVREHLSSEKAVQGWLLRYCSNPR